MLVGVCVCVGIFNLHKQGGPVPSMATSMWQHVTHLISKHTHTYSSVLDCGTTAVCWEIRLQPTGGADFMEASLPHPLSPSTGLRRRYQVAGSAPARLGAGGGLWSCVCVCFISKSLRISAHNAAVSSRYVGVIYSVAELMSTHRKSELIFRSKVPRIFYTTLHSPMCKEKCFKSAKLDALPFVPSM